MTAQSQWSRELFINTQAVRQKRKQTRLDLADVARVCKGGQKPLSSHLTRRIPFGSSRRPLHHTLLAQLSSSDPAHELYMSRVPACSFLLRQLRLTAIRPWLLRRLPELDELM